MKRMLVIICTLLASASCERSESQPGQSSTALQPAESQRALPTAKDSKLNAPASAEAKPADNTDRNERDRGGATLTAGDQGESEADRTITQMIRKAVVADDALSTAAKNAKIITVNGVVTLRGPVKSSQEKSQLGTLSSHVEGVKRVDNQLEIASN